MPSAQITTNCTLSIVSGTVSLAGTRRTVFTQAGSEAESLLVVCPQSADAAIELTPLSNIGFLYVENTDAGNYLELSSGTGGSFAAGVFETVPPGGVYCGHPKAATVYWKAHTADCCCRVVAAEA